MSVCASFNGGTSGKLFRPGTKATSAFIWRRKSSKSLLSLNCAAKVSPFRRSAACSGSCSAKWAGAWRKCYPPIPSFTSLTDGKSIFLEDQQERIIDLLKHARQPMFLVCVSDQVRRLDEAPKKPVRSEVAASKRTRAAV